MTREEITKSMSLQDAIQVFKDTNCYGTMDIAKSVILKALEQETVSKESYDHEYFLRKEFELKIDKLQRQLEEQAMKAEPILDKIRAEIEKWHKEGTNWSDIRLMEIENIVNEEQGRK